MKGGALNNYKPENDGIDHINVYSKSNNWLGKTLSNFHYSPILTEDGYFKSIEGYWYWLGTDHKDKEKLRNLYGYEAKRIGRELKAKDWQDSPEFKRKIKSAIFIKLHSLNLNTALKENKLPYTHYYVYGDKVVNVPEAEWILDIIREFTNE